jgi:hypothetical protein
LPVAELPLPLPTGIGLGQDGLMARLYHVSSSSNRGSILANGLGSALMERARGIAGSRSPEQDGCFLCLSEQEVAWFVQMNNIGGTEAARAPKGLPQINTRASCRRSPVLAGSGAR